MASKDILDIERLGGMAGFGLPNSRLKSRGRCALANLTEADRKAIDGLFAKRAKARDTNVRDGFSYRITRETAGGTETVVVPEAMVPPALVAVVKDEIV